jgi:hypothetical protein
VGILSPAAIQSLNEDLTIARERDIPKLERKIEVLEEHIHQLNDVLQRDRKRIQSETALFADKIAAGE